MHNLICITCLTHIFFQCWKWNPKSEVTLGDTSVHFSGLIDVETQAQRRKITTFRTAKQWQTCAPFLPLVFCFILYEIAECLLTDIGESPLRITGSGFDFAASPLGFSTWNVISGARLVSFDYQHFTCWLLITSISLVGCGL